MTLVVTYMVLAGYATRPRVWKARLRRAFVRLRRVWWIGSEDPELKLGGEERYQRDVRGSDRLTNASTRMTPILTSRSMSTLILSCSPSTDRRLC